MRNINSPQGPGWVDLVAFLGVLALGGTLLAVTRMTAASLTAVCAALGGLYVVFERLLRAGDPGDPPGSDGTGPVMPADDHVDHPGPPGIGPHD